MSTNALQHENQKREAIRLSGCHRLKSIAVIGGFLDGARLDLADGLNCVIGARGTGKTTALELVRYAMDALHSADADAADRRRTESLVQRNLAGGQIELEIETKEGLAYIITRGWGEDPMVLTADRKPTDLTLRSGDVFRADIFSQNEVERIADQTGMQLELLDAFEAEAIAEVNAQLGQLWNALQANASQIVPLESRLAAITEELRCLPAVEARLQAYATNGENTSGEINQAHFLKALRDREDRVAGGVSEVMAEARKALDGVRGRIQARISGIVDREVAEGPNGILVQTTARLASQCGDAVDRLIEQALAHIVGTQQQITEQAKKLSLAHKEQEIVFRSLMAKHQQAQGMAAERTRLEKARNDLLAKRWLRDELGERRGALRQERNRLLEELSELHDRRFAIRQAVAGRLNGSLAPAIRVSVVQYGNPELYQRLLESALRGARIKQGVVAGKVVTAFWPAELSEVVAHKNIEFLVHRAELNYEQAEKVIAALGSSEVLFQLETVELLDLPQIELRDGATYKDCSTLSTGQKCTAILPILLLESDRPLLIDQPEDNLDNRFIFETVVDSIRKIKRRRQLIFVTHNTNIPVLGDAERVFVLESDGSKARKANEGTVEECKREIVTLLEGGEEAFRLRKQRYAY